MFSCIVTAFSDCYAGDSVMEDCSRTRLHDGSYIALAMDCMQKSSLTHSYTCDEWRRMRKEESDTDNIMHFLESVNLLRYSGTLKCSSANYILIKVAGT